MNSYQISQKVSSQLSSKSSNPLKMSKKESVRIKQSQITDDFFKEFIQTCVLAQWRYQILARKYQKRNTRKPTKKDVFLINTKKLVNATSNIFSEHVANYLYDICDIMGQMPPKPGVTHDKNYGTIKIVNNHTLDVKSMKRIKFLSKLYFIIKINTSLEDILLQSINKMKENREKKN